MAASKDIYVHFDELEDLPALNKENYMFETEYLVHKLPPDCTALQVGSMDGIRGIRLLQLRPDLVLSGLEIEAELVDRAKNNLVEAGLSMDFVVADITDPPQDLRKFDAVFCLNNTLGFIPDFEEGIRRMRIHGDYVYLSVFGEAFTDALAKQYFEGIGMSVGEISGNSFEIRDFGRIRRFSRQQVTSWGGTVEVTPLGYLTVLAGNVV